MLLRKLSAYPVLYINVLLCFRWLLQIKWLQSVENTAACVSSTTLGHHHGGCRNIRTCPSCTSFLGHIPGSKYLIVKELANFISTPNPNPDSKLISSASFFFVEVTVASGKYGNVRGGKRRGKMLGCDHATTSYTARLVICRCPCVEMCVRHCFCISRNSASRRSTVCSMAFTVTDCIYYRSIQVPKCRSRYFARHRKSVLFAPFVMYYFTCMFFVNIIVNISTPTFFRLFSIDFLYFFIFFWLTMKLRVNDTLL